MVLQPINQQLQKRIRQCNTRMQPPQVTLLYHDDTPSIVLPYEDIPWFLTTFQTLGDPLDIRLNLTKTQILLSFTDESPIEHLSQTQQQSLIQAMMMLSPKTEQRHGMRLLGQPIGSQTFSYNFINNKITKLQETINTKLFHRIFNLQTQLAKKLHHTTVSITLTCNTRLPHFHTTHGTRLTSANGTPQQHYNYTSSSKMQSLL